MTKSTKKSSKKVVGKGKAISKEKTASKKQASKADKPEKRRTRPIWIVSTANELVGLYRSAAKAMRAAKAIAKAEPGKLMSPLIRDLKEKEEGKVINKRSGQTVHIIGERPV